MNIDRWEEIRNSVKKNFGLLEEGREDLFVDTAEGRQKNGDAEFVVFKSPLGRTKLELLKKPRLEEEKYHFSHRQGDAARVEYKHSDTEFVYALKAYKWDDIDEEWKEIDADKFHL